MSLSMAINDHTYLPDLLLCPQVRTLVTQLLQKAIASNKILGHAVAFDVDASVLIVEMLITFLEVLILALLNHDLLLDHAMALYRQ